MEEALTLSLNGSQAEMGAVLRKLEEFVYLANRFTEEGVGNPRYLRLKYAGESLYSYARILHARLEMTGNSLASQSGFSAAMGEISTLRLDSHEPVSTTM